ncbi:MAG TPA: pilus assembly protein [Trinickia sp.]|jgi:Flp pilus assembly protein TadD|nr:pilus assembly protein [Trinickia sp.]
MGSACAFKESGYGVGAKAERAAAQQSAQKDPVPDTPGMYLALIDRMQTQGLYYASLAHIDAYEKQYGASPDSTLLRAEALRATGQPEAGAAAYRALLATPLAARGCRGLGLIAGAAGNFGEAASQLARAAQLEPADASTLSDLGYARLREGDIDGARVPLMKASELDDGNSKILSNVALLLIAQGHGVQARALMDERNFAADVRTAIREDAMKVAAAWRTRRSNETAPPNVSAQQASSKASTGPGATMANRRPVSPDTTAFQSAPRLLERFAQ